MLDRLRGLVSRRICAAWLSAGLVLASCGSPTTSSPPPTPIATPTQPVGTAQVSPTPPTQPPTPSASPPAASASAPAVGPCGPFDAFCGPYGWKATFAVPFTSPVDCGVPPSPCQLMLDIYDPVATPGSSSPPAAGRPLIVAIPGGPAGLGFRGGLSPLASALAVRGAVVMLADWRESPRWGGGYPVSFQDVACAIRTARAIGPAYGADPSRVTLVGHSFGGFPGAVVALAREPFEPIAGQCLQPTGSSRPDAYVGLAPISSLDDIGQDFLADFFGGPRSARATSWDSADPLLLAAAPDPQTPPIRLAVGTSDGTVPPESVASFAEALRAAGKDVRVTSIDGASHEDILVRPQTLALVLTTAQP